MANCAEQAYDEMLRVMLYFIVAYQEAQYKEMNALFNKLRQKAWMLPRLVAKSPAHALSSPKDRELVKIEMVNRELIKRLHLRN